MIVAILQELTDVDTLHESVEGTAALVQSLSDNQVNKEQHNTATIYVADTTGFTILYR
jgi:hypothetical protein